MPEEINTEEPIEPEIPADIGLIYQRFLEQLQRFQTSVNVRNASIYIQAMANWNRNLPQFGYDEGKMEEAHGRERPEPALAVRYFGRPDFVVIRVEGPGLVSELIDIVGPPEPPPEGVVEFGHPVPGWHAEAYWVGNSTVPAGDRATKDRKVFELIELGQFGTLFFRRMWVLVD